MIACTPKYRLHKGSGQALVQINGRRIYLGKYGTAESKERYRQLVAEWLSGTSTVSFQQRSTVNDDLTVVELILAYLRFAKTYYSKNGSPSREYDNIRLAIRSLKELYGQTQVKLIGPLALRTIQDEMIRLNLARTTINYRIGKIKRVFKWGVSRELVPPVVYQALQTVEGLRKGRTEARESTPVLPVSEATVKATLPQLSEVVKAMVDFQFLTGCRPGEARILRPCDIDKSNDVWVYWPESHKTEHRERERRIYIGPKAREVLRPWLDRESTAYCFNPREAVNCDRKKSQCTKTQRGKTRYPRPSRRGKHYSKDSYNRVITRACERAGIEHWSPNQLRHSRATELRSKFGLEAAQTVLGHSEANVTQVYAERDFEHARRIMQEVG